MLSVNYSFLVIIEDIVTVYGGQCDTYQRAHFFYLAKTNQLESYWQWKFSQ